MRGSIYTCMQYVFSICMFVCEREIEGDRMCVHVRGEAEQECQRCVKLMCQMSVESVRVSPPRGSHGVKTPSMLCLDSCHCRHTADVYLVSSD